MNYVENVLRQIVGEQLSSVTFVFEYFQLHFNGPTINVYSRAFVNSNGERVSSGDVRFKDLLCANIGKVLQAVAFAEGKVLTLSFKEGKEVLASVADSDYAGPVAIETFGFRPVELAF